MIAVGCILGTPPIWEMEAATKECDAVQVDADTYDMLRSLNMANLPGVKQQQVRYCA